MKWVVIGTFALAAVMLVLAWLGTRGADNDNTRALATMFYLPGLAVAALGLLELVGWGVVRALRLF
jgi:hypothetical protein